MLSLRKHFDEIVAHMPWVVEPTPIAEDGALEPQEERTRQLIQFMSELGAAMNSAGDATTFIRRSLLRIARAYGLRDLRISVVPTMLLVRYGRDQATVMDMTDNLPVELRLDQVAQLYDLLEEAEAGKVEPALGLQRLRQALKQPVRSRRPVELAGLSLLALGIGLVLESSALELLICTLLGACAGLIKLAAGRWPAVWPLVPVAAGSITASIAFVLIEAGLEVRTLNVLLPALAAFLPGATITVSMIELSSGDIVAGGSRLAAGSTRLLLLVLGIIIASQLVSPPASTASPSDLPLPRLAPLLGLVVFTCGVALHFTAPTGAFFWMLAVACAAWGAQQATGSLLGGYLSAAIGGAVMIVVARLEQVRPSAPPMAALR